MRRILVIAIALAGLGAASERERLQHPRQPEVVVGVEVREEDLLQVDQPDRAQELTAAIADVERGEVVGERTAEQKLGR